MPTITLSMDNAVITENIMDINFATNVYSSPSSFELSPGKKEGLIKFGMGLIPNDAIITSAVLKLVLNSGTSVDSKVGFHNILGDWINSTVTWNNRPAIDETPATTADVPRSLQSGTTLRFDVTGIIQKQVSSGAVSKGIYLKGVSGNVIFGANGNVSPSQRPQLEVTYSIPEAGKKQVEHVGTTIYSTSSSNNHTINIPTGRQAGDTILAFFTAGVDPIGIETPSGWELLYADNGNSATSLVCKKVSDGTEEQVTFKLSNNGAFNASCTVKVFRNVKTLTQLEKNKYGTAYTWNLPISNVPKNSLLITLASVYTSTVVSNSSKDFYVDKHTTGINYNTNLLYGYNHEKTAFSGTEMLMSFSNSASGYYRILALEPITNVAPNTPPTNNPKGTADIPAILSVSTPKLDWSFSDSDPGDVQSKYQVRIKKASDNSIVHDTGVVTSAVTDYDVPAGVIQKNILYFWEVQTYDSAGVSSSWSSPEYFKLTDQASIGDKFTFNYTGAPQFFTVPGNVLKVKLEAWGAQGGNKIGVNSDPGKGGYAKGELTVTAGELLNLYVGGKGTDGVSSGNINSPGGWNGGGAGGKGANNASGGGGGASDIRKGGTTLADRIIVAGGGGGVSGGVLTRGPYGGGLEGLRGNNGTADFGGYGGTQSAGGATPPGAVSATAGSLGAGGNGENTTSNSYGGAGGGGGYYGGGGGYLSQSGGGGSSYLGTLANAETTAGLREGDGLITITVLEVSNPPTVTSRTPGSTDQTNPAGSSAAPLFSWDYSGAFTQAKYQIKIFNAQGTLAHDTGLIESSAKQHQMAEGVLTAGEVYGWELTVTDDKNVAYPTGRLYIITNRPPGGLTPVSPEDRRRTTLLPVFEATIGDDVENDPQHFVIQLAENSGFTAGLIERKTSTDVTGWEVKTSDGGYVTFPAEGADASFEFGSVKYSLQTPLTEGKTYYWRIAGMDAVTGARGNWSEVRRIRAGNKIDFSLRSPVKTSAAIQRLLIRAQYTLATDGENPAKVRFEACNNAFDENPVWEDVTKAIQSGDYYKFANTEKTADDWGFNIRALFEANDSLDPIEFYGFGISFD